MSANTDVVLKENEHLSLQDAWQVVKQKHPDALLHRPVWESLCAYYYEDIAYKTLLPFPENGGKIAATAIVLTATAVFLVVFPAKRRKDGLDSGKSTNRGEFSHGKDH